MPAACCTNTKLASLAEATHYLCQAALLNWRDIYQALIATSSDKSDIAVIDG